MSLFFLSDILRHLKGSQLKCSFMLNKVLKKKRHPKLLKFKHLLEVLSYRIFCLKKMFLYFKHRPQCFYFSISLSHTLFKMEKLLLKTTLYMNKTLVHY